VDGLINVTSEYNTRNRENEVSIVLLKFSNKEHEAASTRPRNHSNRSY
jgi:hypothetical protein